MSNETHDVWERRQHIKHVIKYPEPGVRPKIWLNCKEPKSWTYPHVNVIEFTMRMDTTDLSWRWEDINEVHIFRVPSGTWWTVNDEQVGLAEDGQGLRELQYLPDNVMHKVLSKDTTPEGWQYDDRSILVSCNALPRGFDRGKNVDFHLAVTLKTDSPDIESPYYMVHSEHDSEVVHHKIRFYPDEQENKMSAIEDGAHKVAAFLMKQQNGSQGGGPGAPDGQGGQGDTDAAIADGYIENGSFPSERLEFCFHMKRNLQKAEKAATYGEWSLYIEYALRNIAANVRLLNDDRLNKYLEDHLDDRIRGMRHETDRVVTELIDNDILNKLHEKLSEKPSDDSQA